MTDTERIKAAEAPNAAPDEQQPESACETADRPDGDLRGRDAGSGRGPGDRRLLRDTVHHSRPTRSLGGREVAGLSPAGCRRYAQAVDRADRWWRAPRARPSLRTSGRSRSGQRSLAARAAVVTGRYADRRDGHAPGR